MTCNKCQPNWCVSPFRQENWLLVKRVSECTQLFLGRLLECPWRQIFQLAFLPTPASATTRLLCPRMSWTGRPSCHSGWEIRRESHPLLSTERLKWWGWWRSWRVHASSSEPHPVKSPAPSHRSTMSASNLHSVMFSSWFCNYCYSNRIAWLGVLRDLACMLFTWNSWTSTFSMDWAPFFISSAIFSMWPYIE